MADKKVAVIYETDNYDKFKIIDGNRPIEHAKKIVESIKEIGMLWQPVLVNERFEIIDGQGRYLASKTLGKKILYVVQPGLTIKHARCLNENSTIWKIKDYIHSYAVGADSKSEFTNFETVQKQFPEFNVKLIVKAAGDLGLGSSCLTSLKNGTYDKMDFDHMNTAIRRLTKLRKFDTIIPKKFAYRNILLGAIIFCIYVSEVDADFSLSQLEDAVSKNLDLVSSSPNLVDMIDNLDYMYNYKRTGKNRYAIKRKYEDSCTESNIRNLPTVRRRK